MVAVIIVRKSMPISIGEIVVFDEGILSNNGDTTIPTLQLLVIAYCLMTSQRYMKDLECVTFVKVNL